jgi:hypothetical protein
VPIADRRWYIWRNLRWYIRRYFWGNIGGYGRRRWRNSRNKWWYLRRYRWRWRWHEWNNRRRHRWNGGRFICRKYKLCWYLNINTVLAVRRLIGLYSVEVFYAEF